MIIVQFTYEYGHRDRREDSHGNGYYIKPVLAVATKNFVVEDDYSYVREMLWTYISERFHLGDEMFRRVESKALDIKIDGTFKEPQFYLKNA